MIRILFREAKASAIICCDECGDMIGESQDGIVLFEATLKENEKTEVQHLHKGKCLEQVRGRLTHPVGSHDLSYHLILLCINTCVEKDAFITYVRTQLDDPNKGASKD